MPDVMFPGGSPHLVEPIYKDPALSAPFNEQLAAVVLAHCQRRLPGLGAGQVIRIVEIGSGSGGTSAVVLAALKAAAGRHSCHFARFRHFHLASRDDVQCCHTVSHGPLRHYELLLI